MKGLLSGLLLVLILGGGCDITGDGLDPVDEAAGPVVVVLADEPHPLLEVVNANTQPIVRVSLLGYNVAPIQIQPGDSQILSLDQGMPGGYENIWVEVLRETSTVRTGYFDFADGETTTITLTTVGIE